MACGLLQTTFTTCRRCQRPMMVGRRFCVCCGGRPGSAAVLVLGSTCADAALTAEVRPETVHGLAQLFLQARFGAEQEIPMHEALELAPAFESWLGAILALAGAEGA